MHVPIPLKDFIKLQTLLSQASAVINRIICADDVELPDTEDTLTRIFANSPDGHPAQTFVNHLPAQPTGSQKKSRKVEVEPDDEVEYEEYGAEALD